MVWDIASSHARDLELKVLQLDTGPAGIMYRSCMDVARIEKVGASPLKPWLALIDKISDKATLVEAVAGTNSQKSAL